MVKVKNNKPKYQLKITFFDNGSLNKICIIEEDMTKLVQMANKAYSLQNKIIQDMRIMPCNNANQTFDSIRIK